MKYGTRGGLKWADRRELFVYEKESGKERRNRKNYKYGNLEKENQKMFKKLELWKIWN